MLAAGGLGSCLVRPFTAAMTVQNTAGFFPADVLLAKIPHRLARGPGGLLRNPATDELALRVQFLALQYRVVDSQGVDAGQAGLHLSLRVVNARLEIGEQAGQVQGWI